MIENNGQFEAYTAAAHASERLPLLVVIHGFGGTPDRIAEVVAGLRLKARALAPRGIYPVGGAVGNGWSWFPREKPFEDLAPDIVAAADVLDREITAEVASRPTCGKPIVLGFSQGGFMSYALVARIPDKIAAALPLGGGLPRSLWPQKAPAAPLRVTAFHGELDNIVDPHIDRETNAAFLARGYGGALHMVPDAQHRLPPDAIVAMREQIEREIRDEGCVVP